MQFKPQGPFVHFVGELDAIRQLGTTKCSVVLLDGSPVLRPREPTRRNKSKVVHLTLKHDGLRWMNDPLNEVLEDEVNLPDLTAPSSASVHIVITHTGVDVIVGE